MLVKVLHFSMQKWFKCSYCAPKQLCISSNAENEMETVFDLVNLNVTFTLRDMCNRVEISVQNLNP